MAIAKSAAERALEILAEIDKEEKLNSKSNPPEINNSTKITASTINTNKTNSNESNLDLEKTIKDFSQLGQNDLVRGIIMSELINKPVSLRRNRKI